MCQTKTLSEEDITCYKCHEHTDKEVVIARIPDENMTVKLHPACFNCEQCHKSLAGAKYLCNDHKFYCEEDYVALFNPKCHHCEENVKGDYVKALGYTWCINHFVCSDCGNGFPTGEFHKIDNQPYCKPCYLERTKIECNKCGEHIEKEMIQALDKKYHRECFTCAFDGHIMDENTKILQYEGSLYCMEHLTKKLQFPCAECQQPIFGEYIKVFDKHIHKSCWKCKVCEKALTLNAEEVQLHDGVFYCKTCPLPDGAVADKTGQNEREPRRSINGAILPHGVCEYFTYEQLHNKNKRPNLPEGVDILKREAYLDDDTFEKLFGMTKMKFYRLAKWRQKQKKIEVHLF